jgi:hypothetical protein
MRKCVWRSALGMLGPLLLALEVSATPVVEIVWIEPAPDSVDKLLAPDDLVTGEIRIAADGDGVSSYGVSLRFDDDLTFESAEELLPGAFDFNLGPGIAGSTADTVLTFEAATFGPGASNASFVAGRVVFRASAPKDDGIDVVPGFFNAGIDGLFSSAGDDLGSSVEFHGASVQLVPEVGTLALLVPGIAGLAMMGRRRSPHVARRVGNAIL